MNRKIFQLIFVLIIISAFGVIIKNYVDSIVSNIEDYKLVLDKNPQTEISRLSPIVIHLSQDIDNQKFPLNLPIENNFFKFSPDISGYLYFTDRKTIEFQPNNPLKAGQEYSAKLDVKKIFPRINKKPFHFRFTTPELTYRIKIKEVVYVDSLNNDKPAITGNITFNDYVEFEKKQKLVSAIQDGKSLIIKYSPGNDNKSIEFKIIDIERTHKKEHVAIKWNGKPIDSKKADSTNIEIISKDSFDVVFTKMIYFPKPLLTIRLTDPIDSASIIDSMISISNLNTYNIEVSKNEINIHFNETTNRIHTLFISDKLKNEKGIELTNNFNFNFNLLTNSTLVDIVDKSHFKPFNKTSNLFEISALNIKNLNIEITHVPDKNMMQFLQVNNIDGVEEIQRVGKQIFSKTYNLNEDIDYLPKQIANYKLDFLGVNLSKGGLYNFKISYNDSSMVFKTESGNGADNTKKNKTIQNNIVFSDIMLIGKLNSLDSLYIFASHMQNGNPIQNGRVEIFDYQQNLIGTLLTNSNGVAKTKVEGSQFFIRVTHNNQISYLKVNKSTSEFILNKSGVKSNKGYLCHIEGLKSIYDPSDSIRVGIILKKNGKLLQSQELVEIKLKTPEGKYINTQLVTFSAALFKTYNAKLPFNAAHGIWKIILSNSITEFQYPFKVFDQPKLELPLSFILNTKKNTIELIAKGTLLKNAKIKTTIKPIDKIPSLKYQHYIFANNESSTQLEKIYTIELNKYGKATIKIPDWFESGKSYKLTSKAKLLDDVVLNTDTIIRLNGISNRLGMKIIQESEHSILVDLLILNNDLIPSTNNSNIQLNIQLENLHNSKSAITMIDTSLNFKGQSIITIPIQPQLSQINIQATNTETKQTISYLSDVKHQKKNQYESRIKTHKESYSTHDTCIITIEGELSEAALITAENSTQIFNSKWINPISKKKEFSFVITEEMLPGIYINLTSFNSRLCQYSSKYISVYVTDINNYQPITADIPYDWKSDGTTTIHVSNPNSSDINYLIFISGASDSSSANFSIPNYFNQKQQNPTKNYSSVNMAQNTGCKANISQANFKLETFNLYENNYKYLGDQLILGPYKIEGKQKQAQHIFLPNIKGALNIKLLGYHPNSANLFEIKSKANIINPISIISHHPKYLNAEDLSVFPIEIANNTSTPDSLFIDISDAKNLDIISLMEYTLMVNPNSHGTYYLKTKVKKISGEGKFTLSVKSRNNQLKKTITIPIYSNPNVVSTATSKQIAPDEQWQKTVSPFGIKGTNSVLFEFSTTSIPPISKLIQNISENSKQELIIIINQTFPLIYMNKIISDKKTIELNTNKIKSALFTIIEYQTIDGGFSYEKNNIEANGWLSSYLGEFILAAKQNNIKVNDGMLNKWQRYQKTELRKAKFNDIKDISDKAYTIYTLGQANAIEIDELNEIGTSNNSLVNNLYIANTYASIGKYRMAKTIIETNNLYQSINSASITENSLLLKLAVILKQPETAVKFLQRLNQEIENKSNKPTDVAIALSSIMQTIKYLQSDKTYKLEYQVNNGKTIQFMSQSELSYIDIPLEFTLSKNTDFTNTFTDTIFMNYWQTGNPQLLNKPNTKLKGLEISNGYYDFDNNTLNTQKLNLENVYKQVLEYKNITKQLLQDFSVSIPIPAGVELLYSNIDKINIQESGNTGIIELQVELDKSEHKKIVLIYKAKYQGEYLAYPIKTFNNNSLNGKAFTNQSKIKIN
ncbi:MAG: hypothetical protein PF517_03670 [Salinivirgaceae bacterium]|jgi:uncharacterized protein YfaS (alpha-2-macroglobulin family)|nr:hypothetical protein [Salinivirgaceae bacterium]